MRHSCCTSLAPDRCPIRTRPEERAILVAIKIKRSQGVSQQLLQKAVHICTFPKPEACETRDGFANTDQLYSETDPMCHEAGRYVSWLQMTDGTQAACPHCFLRLLKSPRKLAPHEQLSQHNFVALPLNQTRYLAKCVNAPATLHL
jgi:hypothetical protein